MLGLILSDRRVDCHKEKGETIHTGVFFAVQHANHLQILSYNVVHLALIEIQTHISGDRH
jgi:hypothetical protein